MLIKTAAQLLSPIGQRGRLSVLIFHRVRVQRDPLFQDELDAERFDTVLGWVTRWFNVLPLDIAAAALRDGSLPPRAMAITFDDGYADNHDVALPILKRHGVSATFFIATGFLDGGRMWNDTVIEAVRATRRDRLDLSAIGVTGLDSFELDSLEARRRCIFDLLAALKYLHPQPRQRLVDRIADLAAVELPTELMLSSKQVLHLRSEGMQIGAHTVNHPILAGLAREEARAEIANSRLSLEALLGERIGLFAYPNGRPNKDYSLESVDIVRELGFDMAVTTAPGAATRVTDRYQVPRFTPWDKPRSRFGARLIRNLVWSNSISNSQETKLWPGEKT